MKMATIIQTKGGIGKTSISFNLVKSLNDTFYLTNDSNSSKMALKILGDKKSQLVNLGEKFKVPQGTEFMIYDTGGYIDNKTNVKALENSDLIIIPTMYTFESLEAVKTILNDIKTLKLNSNQNIIICINNYYQDRYKKEDILNDINDIIENSINENLKNYNIKIEFIRNTKELFEMSLSQKMGIEEYINSKPLLKHAYSKFLIEDYIPFIESVKLFLK